jgi:hypothetical protein
MVDPIAGGAPPIQSPVDDAPVVDPGALPGEKKDDAKIADVVNALSACGKTADKATAEQIIKKLDAQGYDTKNMSGNDIVAAFDKEAPKLLDDSLMDDALKKIASLLPANPTLSNPSPNQIV